MHDHSGLGERLSWDDVRLFLALFRAESVGKAARGLGVDGSTVSRRLATLEGVLAVTLFDRSRAGITPTKAAEDLMPIAEQIEEAMLQFASAAENLERDVSGLVRITCPADAAEVAVVPLLPELLRRHPALRVDLDAGEALLDLTRREADLALRTVRPERGDLIVTRLMNVTWVLAAAPKLARSIGALRAWTDAPWVGCGESWAHTAPARWYARHVKNAEPTIRSDSLRVQLSVIASGAALGLVPAPSLAHYRLVPVKLTPALHAAAEEWPTDELFLVTHRALRNVPRVRVVWELLRERLSAAPR
jgi:DNA-binding transcriptional LysR family regulator